MNWTRCAACDSPLITRHLRVQELMFGTGESFTYAECGECGSLRLLDPPTDLAPYYPRDYYSLDVDPEVALGKGVARLAARTVARSTLFGSGAVATAAHRTVPVRQFRSLVTLLNSVSTAGLSRGRETRILDVGCGSGVLIYVLALAGAKNVVGVDPFVPDDREFTTGAMLHRLPLSEVRSCFDLVMLHHSLEHVPDPRSTLQNATGLLGSDGRLLVRMPTPSSYAFERYQTDWVQLDPPRHLNLLTRRGMQIMARSLGLRVVDVVDDSSAFQFWGSEQVSRQIPLASQRSHMVNPSASEFSGSELRRWSHSSRRLNQSGRGDQAAWVLERMA